MLLPQLSDLRDDVPWVFAPVAYRQMATPELDLSIGLYNGTPNAADFDQILKMIGPMQAIADSTPEDWLVLTCNACDNTLGLDMQAFSPSILSQYGDRASGRSFLINHELRDVEKAKGFIIDSALYRSETLPEWLSDSVPNSSVSRSLMEAQGGYYWVMLKVAIPVDSPIAQAALTRSLDRLSVGFFPFDSNYYCPDCSYTRQQNTHFGETETTVYKGPDGKSEVTEKKICPHTAPTWWNLLLARWGYLEDDVEWSNGEIYDADIVPHEISAVNQGAFGSARIIRREKY